MTQPSDKQPPGTTQSDLDEVPDDHADDEVSETSPGPSSTMAQTGEVEPGDPSSTLLFDDEEDLVSDEPTTSKKTKHRRPKPAPPPPTTGTQPAMKRPASGTRVPKLEVSSSVVKPAPYRRPVLSAGDAFEAAPKVPQTNAPTPQQGSQGGMWAVTIGGARVTIVELILTVLALLIFAGVAWLFL